jgi:hypothetical protein
MFAVTQISEICRHRCLQVPKTYLPVVQAMLNELGGLGFISTTVLSSAMLRSACRADRRESGLTLMSIQVFVLTHPGGQLFSTV